VPQWVTPGFGGYLEETPPKEENRILYSLQSLLCSVTAMKLRPFILPIALRHLKHKRETIHSKDA